MDELDKLKVLLEHWIEHNIEHAREYKRWAEKAEVSNRKDLAKVLDRLSIEAGRLNSIFEEALSILADKEQ